MKKIITTLIVVCLYTCSHPTLVLAQTQIKPSEVRCMADNMYQEARGERTAGLVAVGQVVLNRVKSKKFPDTVCEVVYQNKVNIYGLTVYQFSWLGKEDTSILRELDRYRFMLDISEGMLNGWYSSIYEGIYFYYACDGDYKIDPPFWAEAYKLIAKEGNHCFYGY